MANNICVPHSGQTAFIFIASPSGGNYSNPGYSMSPSTASNEGFTSTNKYYPNSIGLADPSVKGAGTNLSGSCSGELTSLCQDAEGAPWYGLSYKPRTVPWDMGAYVLTTGSGAPAATLTPPSLAFGNQNTGTTSAVQYATFTSTGTASW